MIKPIETRYAGYRFRSRLEARWAVFFDALGLKWEYEPEGFELPFVGRYLPDFKVRYPGRGPDEVHYEWFEVKPDNRLSEVEISKLVQFAQNVDRITVLDGTPTTGMYANMPWMGSGSDAGWAVPEFKEALKDLPENRCGYALWSGKGRMWWDDCDNYFKPTTYFGSYTTIEDAVTAAREARFEFGETP
jgi:hypothetical protein